MLDYDTPRYPIRQAAAAAGFELNTLRSLYQRGHFEIVGGEEAKARGLAAFLNLRDVMHIAVSKRLIDMGIHASDAFIAGKDFAHTSSGRDAGQHAHRLPAELYRGWFTVLVYHPALGSGRVLPMTDGLQFSDLFHDPHAGGRHNPVVIFLNDVEREVFTALNVTPATNVERLSAITAREASAPRQHEGPSK